MQASGDDSELEAILTETKPKNFKIDDDLISQMSSMGYDLEMCKLCLEAFRNDLAKAVNFFLENKDNLLDSNLIKSKLEAIIQQSKSNSNSPTSSRGAQGSDQPTTSASSLLAEQLHENITKTKNAQDLLDNLAKEMPDDDEAYLDLNVDEDALFINKYYSLLDS